MVREKAIEEGKWKLHMKSGAYEDFECQEEWSGRGSKALRVLPHFF